MLPRAMLQRREACFVPLLPGPMAGLPLPSPVVDSRVVELPSAMGWEGREARMCKKGQNNLQNHLSSHSPPLRVTCYSGTDGDPE